MSSTPSNPRTFAANTPLGIKLTPSNSAFPRTPRSPNKTRSLYESGLSLKRIIGTTVSSPTAFHSLSSSRIFAYTAGAAAVVVNIADTSKYSQRFFRARPTAIPLTAVNTTSCTPCTPTNTANDGRNRTVAALRDSAVPFPLSTPHTTHTSLEFGDSPTSKTWTSRERIKAATCVSISRDGRFLAVGETGYSPRVLIFSLQENSSDIPLVILNEHSIGVTAVAFSPDQKYLASLGAPNDGFLYVWSINQRTGAAKLHSSNKCTSFVKQMIWLGGSIITVGTRHIKVWRVDDGRSTSPTKQRFALDGTPLPAPPTPILKTLAGRNVLLGPLVDATFTTLAAISDHKAIVGSEKGDVCLLDDSEGQKLVKLANTGFYITCIAVDVDERRVRIGGRNGKFRSMSLDALLTPSTPPESPTPSIESSPTNEAGDFCAMGFAATSLITVDSKHSIEISSPGSDIVDPSMQNTPFPAHGDSVLGVRLLSSENEMEAAFLTWSANGTIVFWDLEGNSKASLRVELEQLPPGEGELVNQCSIIRVAEGAAFLVAGDRYGVLRVVNPTTKVCTFDARAHSSEILDLALHEDGDNCLIASCSRDRTVQLFRLMSSQWVLMQTLDDHTASICGLFFTENGDKLLSCSSDRTIHIRELVTKEVGGQDVMVAVPLRIITLKAAPVSMSACFGDQMGTFVVSLLDRTVATFEISSGRLINSFKATDNDGAEAVALAALVMGTPSATPGRPTILAGVSSTDKSIRVYDGSTGTFLDREWGHTASVTGVALLENSDSEQKTLISTGSDGTIMIWDLSPRVPELLDSAEFSGTSDPAPLKTDTPSTRPPLRRVLSRAELAEFQRASPTSTPGNRSPPRLVRRKTSRYGLSGQSPTLAPPVPPVNSKHFTSVSDEPAPRRSTRHRSRSPPPSPKARRPSLANLDTRARTKIAGNSFSEFGSLNMATEQACRTLRAYRKKLLSSEAVKESLLKELDQELRLTAVALGERSMKAKQPISETALAGLLDQYSERLVAIFDEKVRNSRRDSGGDSEFGERPKTAGNPSTSSPGG